MPLVDLSEFPVPLKNNRSQLALPLASGFVPAGFPSPADDYMDTGIDLNEELIKHPTSTFFLRVRGESMTGAGIHNGDLLVVDRSLDPVPGHIVIAILDGAFTLKRLVLKNGFPYLEADHPSYSAIDLRQYGDVQIWGVAVHSIHNLNSIRKLK